MIKSYPVLPKRYQSQAGVLSVIVLCYTGSNNLETKYLTLLFKIVFNQKALTLYM